MLFNLLLAKSVVLLLFCSNRLCLHSPNISPAIPLELIHNCSARPKYLFRLQYSIIVYSSVSYRNKPPARVANAACWKLAIICVGAPCCGMNAAMRSFTRLVLFILLWISLDVCSSLVAHLAAMAATWVRIPASCQILYT